MAGKAIILTRFIVISNSHEFEFSHGIIKPLNFQHPPRADVFLHCGDMTHVGGVVAFKKFLRILSNFDAELKLVIAGNHDLALDKDWRHYERHPERKYFNNLKMRHS